MYDYLIHLIGLDYGQRLLEIQLKLNAIQLQCFGHLMQRTDSLEKTLMLGRIEG